MGLCDHNMTHGVRLADLGRIRFYFNVWGSAEMTSSGAPFVIALSGVVHEVLGVRSYHKVLHSYILT